MRQIKFRAWDKSSGQMANFTLSDITDMGTEVFGGTPDVTYWDLDEVEIMQFTGLLDKNGKDIYEGDIITDANGSKWEIKFGDGNFGCFYPNGEWHKPTKDFREVIGSIYQNPELLK